MRHIHPLRSLAASALALSLACLAGCGGGSSSTTSPSTGVSPATTTPGPRIVSTVPAATLQLVQLGAVDSLVGISSYDRLVLPEDKQNLPIVGDYLDLRYETILSLKPTAIIVQMADERLAPRLKEIAEQHKIELVNLRLDTIADLYATAERLGKLAGKSREAQGKVALAKLQLDALRRRTEKFPHPKVVYIVGKSPIFIVGGHRFMDEMITIAGGQNVGATLKSDFPTVSREDLLKLAPEVILIAAPGEPPASDDDPRLAPWRELGTPAGKSGRVYLVTGLNSQMASLEIAEETLALARLIHPEVKDWSLPAEPADTRPADTSPAAKGTP